MLGILCLLVGGFFVDPASMNSDDPQQIIASLGPVASLLLWAGNVNLVLAIFNLVPAYPLDGGRVLRGILWGLTGEMEKATRWAAWGGRAFGSLLMAAGIAMILGVQVPFFGRGFVGGIWLIFIGWFLSRAALVSYQTVEARRSLANVKVRDIMRRDYATLTPALSLDEVVEQHLLPSGTRAYPVLQNDELLGLITFDDIRRVPRERWSQTLARDIMVERASLVTVAPGDGGFQALSQLSEHNINQMPVVDNGQPVGMVYREDILQWLQLYGAERLAA